MKRRRLLRPMLEELEPRLPPATFSVKTDLAITALANCNNARAAAHAVVFFESSVADYQILMNGLNTDTDAVVLDSGVDGLREMAAFLANRHTLTSIGVVAHGAPGAIMLGTTTLDVQNIRSYAQELAAIGSALSKGGELDLWSCDVAAGPGGAAFVKDIATASGASVAAADHAVGSPKEGGNWQLNIRMGVAKGETPFSATAQTAFGGLLDTWSPAGSMATARESHTATLLLNGKVLVAGGFIFNGDKYLSSAELYDPLSDTWSSAGSMAMGRSGHGAVLLASGKVLVMGGINGTALSSAELYDPMSNSWSSAGAMTTPREDFTATLLTDGRVLVAGGEIDSNNVFSSAELYDPLTNTWSTTNSMGAARRGHTATLLTSGKVLVAGGYNDVTGQFLSSAELFDPVTNTWSPAAAPLMTPVGDDMATLLVNGKVLVTGPRTDIVPYTELYDPFTNGWSFAADLPNYLIGNMATSLRNGRVLITGGYGNGTPIAELYNPFSNSWSSAGALSPTRAWSTATLLNSGSVLVTGGQGFNGTNDADLSSAELYEPDGPDLLLSTTSLISSSATSIYGQAITITATETAGAAPVTSGDVTFVEGNTLLSAHVPLNANGQAFLSIANLSATASPHVITAFYSGSSQFTSNIGTTTQTIKPEPITVSADTQSKIYGSADPSLTYRITAGALYFGDAFSGALTRMRGEAAGTYAILLGTLSLNGNYTLKYVGAALTIRYKFAVTVLGANGKTVVAGNSFLVTAQGLDSSDNPVTSGGPFDVSTATATPADPKSNFPIPGTLNSHGFAYFLGNLKTPGIYTINTTANQFAGSTDVTVIPAPAAYFVVSAPANAITGSSFLMTVTAYDTFGNYAYNYTGKVHFTSSDPKATLPADVTLTNGTGAYKNVTLNTAGSQTITATDAVSSSPITITGTSAPIAATGLKVTALTKTPTGFTANFNQAINPADLTLYGKGNTQQDVLLVGQNTNNGQPYPGTLFVDGQNAAVTFNVSSSFLAASNPGGSPTLPDDTYTVTLLSGVGNNGFQDVSGQGFDDGPGGHADFLGTFTTTYQHDKTPILGIPDFARGPNASGDTTTLVKVPNDPGNGGHIGIPITIYNASNLSSAGFTLIYNANILTVTGGISDPSNPGATLQMTSNFLGENGEQSLAIFVYTGAAPTSGTRILGDITAYVPYSARSQYQVKDLLALGIRNVDGGGARPVPANAVDVNAYFGDVNGDHHLDGVDKGLIANVASTLNTGFTAFTLLDPAIIGDLSGDNAVTSNSTSLMSNYLLGLPVAKIPALPHPAIADNLFTSPFGADPVLSVTPADITLGSIPSQATGWQLSATVNAALGEIPIQLYSQTPIATDQAGSLVNITFAIKTDTAFSKTTVRLVGSKTVLADDQAAMILRPGLDWTAVLAGIG